MRENRQQARRNEGQAVDSPEQGSGAFEYPRILWPKFEDQAVGERLALIGSMNDEILNREEMALSLLVFIGENYPEALEKRYQLTLDTAAQMATHRRPSIRPSPFWKQSASPAVV